jgi:bla regulator protein BlaR1
MLSVMVAIALKSLLVSGLTLGLLALLMHRSAAERSWVAHIGLLALVIMALAPFALPRWNVEAPALFASAPAAVQADVSPSTPPTVSLPKANSVAVAPRAPSRIPAISASAAASAIYAVPAAILLFITFLALVRLLALRARAEVLVDGHWLTALARAQKRMGFKHGTALLTSNALASPVSWGLVRPVILLNSRAVEASGEAEAILAHELAHVARMDWAKLLLARVATALFWFNPLVWVLAREAHQLREETADDAVLAADIADTDYAQLLVGVARHECPGLLLGAHGVAPSKSSLARRVARVLDGKSVRGPVARGFAVGVFTGAVLIAAPLAALTLTTGGPILAKPSSARTDGFARYYGRPISMADVPTDLPHIIASGVSTSVAAAMAAARPLQYAGATPDYMAKAPDGSIVTSRNGTIVARAADGSIVTTYPPDAQGRRRVVARAANGATAVSYLGRNDVDADESFTGASDGSIVSKHGGTTFMRGADGATITQRNGTTLMRGADGATMTIYPPDAQGRSRVVAQAVDGATTVSYVAANEMPPLPPVPPPPQEGHQRAIDRALQMKAVGITQQYIDAMRAASPGLRDADLHEMEGLKSVGVTPQYVQDLAKAGFGNLSVKAIEQVYAVGLTPDYMRRIRAINAHASLQDMMKLKSMNITPEEFAGTLRRTLDRPPTPQSDD